MAKFYGSYIEKKPHLNRTILAWLSRLSDDFHVFVELEGSDFQIDFLVLKRYGVFDVEAKDWEVTEAHLDADWILANGDAREDPFIQVLDQCAKVKDYILYQRAEIFSTEKARIADSFKNDLKVFPVVALSRPYGSASIFTHPFRRVFVDDIRLKKHLVRFEWFPDSEKPFSLEPEEIKKLANLFQLKQFDPRTLAAITTTAPLKVVLPGARPISARTTPGDKNPYQYTYSVVGDEFYGREKELRGVKRALESAPSIPVVITGLQRTGKSSLALESVRRLTAGTEAYTKVAFDFRRLSTEGLKPEEDITFELLGGMAGDLSGSEVDGLIESLRQKAAKATLTEQRRLFHEAVRRNKDRNKRTLLFLDECQEIGDFMREERHQSFFAFLDALCREKELNFHLIVACRSSFFDLEPIRKINFGRLCHVVTLGPLDDESATAVINRGSHVLRFEESAKKRILFIVGKHPFWLQFLCHRIFERSILESTFSVSEKDVNAVFEGIVKDPGCKPQFYLLFQEVENSQASIALLKDVSDAASKEGATVELSSLSKKWSDEETTRKALKPLIENQILIMEHVPEKPAVRFQVEALRAWIRPNLFTL